MFIKVECYFFAFFGNAKNIVCIVYDRNTTCTRTIKDRDFLITNVMSKYDTSTPFFIDLTIYLQAESIHITHRPNVTENHGRKKSHFCPVGHDFEMTYLRHALRYLVTLYILEKPK